MPYLSSMPRVWVGPKELFWLDRVLEKAIGEDGAAPELFILAGRVKAAIEDMELVETRSHAAGT